MYCRLLGEIVACCMRGNEGGNQRFLDIPLSVGAIPLAAIPLAVGGENQRPPPVHYKSSYKNQVKITHIIIIK